MIRLGRPNEAEIGARLAASDAPFPYPEVGATRDFDAAAPRLVAAGYDVDRHVFTVGAGGEPFERARSALQAWRHFEIPWLTLHGAEAPPREGRVVGVLTRAFGLWLLNPSRVVWADDPSDDAFRFAFAYGTLAGHALCGEERFRVCLDPDTGAVAYEIAAFSRPGMLLTRLGRPFARRFQRRFAAASAAALRRAAEGSNGPPA